ncbi:MAG: RagB/SusD family nutrient uptake outer membrane protein [Cyclobacteriaceae bacterium]
MIRRLNHKHTLINALGVAFLLFSITACDPFLDETPDNRVELDNLDKAAQLLTNGYSIASPAFTDWLSDDVQFTTRVTIRQSHEQMYRWEDVTTGPDEQDTPDFFWYETYNSIAHANEVLAVLDDLPVISEEDKLRKDAIEGEAKLIRAYGHFMLVNMFAKHYDQETARDDLGIPYIKTPETIFIDQYERESVRKVYQEIEDDLEDGLELVSDNFYSNSGKYHFTRNATLAFASRFYLYMWDFQTSLRYSNELLGNNPEAFVRDMTSDEFRNAKSSTTGYPQLYSSPDLPSNIMLGRKVSLIQRTDFGHAPSSDFYNGLFNQSLYPNATDERENPAFVKGEEGLLPVRYQSLFQRNSINSNVGTPYHIAILFRGEEVLFNRIECNIIFRDFDAAIADLNVLFRRRYSLLGNADLEPVTLDDIRQLMNPSNDPDFTDFLVMLNYLLLEKRKEFIIQGFRWFDMKRYEIPIDHDFPGGGTITLEVGDPRWVLQIPESAVDVGGLEPNPR